MLNRKLLLPKDQIEDFCHRWKTVEFALFGSVLRDDFGPHSDVDILISFSKDAEWDSYDWVNMIHELKGIFGRDVDLLEKNAIRNPFRRRAILSNREILYAA
jgi:predicted nucleotidyltransferase